MAGRKSISLAFSRLARPATVISASPSTIRTSASKGAACFVRNDGDVFAAHVDGQVRRLPECGGRRAKVAPKALVGSLGLTRPEWTRLRQTRSQQASLERVVANGGNTSG